MKTTRGTRFRVGLFVLVAIITGGTIAFVVGNQANVFSTKTTYFAFFDDVGGLRPGSTVRVAGVDVGTVEEVDFGEEGAIRVEMRVIDTATHLIRRGSTAAVGSKGLLGDRLVSITVGDGKQPVWDPENPIPPAGGEGIMALAERTLGEVEGTARNLRLATDPFSDQKFSMDLKVTAQNLAKVSGMLAEGEGTIQRLISDEKLGRAVDGAVHNLREAAHEFAGLSKNLKELTAEIKNGKGTAHALIYGEEGAEAIANIRDATGDLAALLKDIRHGEGTIHGLIYDEADKGMLANFSAASADIAHLTKEMRAGRGTVGALMTDPSLYEDMKRLIGDLERNEILRALVRYSIRHDEARERIDVTEP